MPAKEKDGLTASQRKERSGTKLQQASLLILLAQCTRPHCMLLLVVDALTYLCCPVLQAVSRLPLF